MIHDGRISRNALTVCSALAGPAPYAERRKMQQQPGRQSCKESFRLFQKLGRPPPQVTSRLLCLRAKCCPRQDYPREREISKIRSDRGTLRSADGLAMITPQMSNLETFMIPRQGGLARPRAPVAGLSGTVGPWEVPKGYLQSSTTIEDHRERGESRDLDSSSFLLGRQYKISI